MYTCWTLALVCTTFHSNAHTHIPKRIYIYMLSWKQCALPVITTMALWQLMHLGTWCMNSSIYCNVLVRRFYTLSAFGMFTVAHESYFFEFPTCRINIYLFTFQKGQILKSKKRKNIGVTNEKFKKITLVQHCKHGKSAQRVKFAGCCITVRAEKTVSMKY